MHRITKILNHNSVLAIHMEDNRENLIMGKGVGFGKKPGERVNFPPDATIYVLAPKCDHGNPRELVRRIDPIYLGIANAIIQEAQKAFGKLDTSILIPMADHIAFAARRIQKNAPISNPLTPDIKALFPQEFQIARRGGEIILEQAGISFSDDELGYIALHIHSSLESMQVSQAMQTARTIRECVELVQAETGARIDVSSLSYDRLMSHIKYMAIRILKGERLSVDVNHLMQESCPAAFEISEKICRQLSQTLERPVNETEVGYLAMHIQRVFETNREENLSKK
ncbi:MAG TPA: PRD domain-containing protein [Candidatus Gallacutalibacter pullistercoris]|nr:PRD domain-containing protein [Candidatus Gallacutalibacter pullistercoris]